MLAKGGRKGKIAKFYSLGLFLGRLLRLDRLFQLQCRVQRHQDETQIPPLLLPNGNHVLGGETGTSFGGRGELITQRVISSGIIYGISFCPTHTSDSSIIFLKAPRSNRVGSTKKKSIFWSNLSKKDQNGISAVFLKFHNSINSSENAANN